MVNQRIEYITVSGFRHRIKRIESGQRNRDLPVIVFLHEGLGCIEFWRDFPEAVCEAVGYEGMIYDRRGYGGSDPFSDSWIYDYLDEESELLKGVLDKAGIENSILIGHSDGGTIALLAAAILTDRIKGIITEAAHVFVEEITIEGIRKVVKIYETQNLKSKLVKYHGTNTDIVFQRWANRWLSPEFRSWNIENRLSGVTCPLLVLQGEDDEYGTVSQVTRIVNGVRGPVRSDFIKNCGHVPHHQSREYVLRQITDFIHSLSM